ncbi:hypothetical protein EfmAA610_32670 (plasmid) [Enterococcus faecium]|nr:hypothetical protein EfmAA610_32670 [Enterococcus faecium]
MSELRVQFFLIQKRPPILLYLRDEYMTKFNEKYPDIKVEIQTITDYAELKSITK